MVDSSKDILFLILSAAIVTLTFFVAWTLFLVIQMLRDARAMTDSVRRDVEKVSELLDLLKEKIASSASYLGIIAEGARHLVKFWQNRQTRKTTKRRTDDEDART